MDLQVLRAQLARKVTLENEDRQDQLVLPEHQDPQAEMDLEETLGRQAFKVKYVYILTSNGMVEIILTKYMTPLRHTKNKVEKLHGDKVES